MIDGWVVLRFSYDHIEDKPRRCQQSIQQLMGKIFGDEHSLIPLTAQEKEVIRFAMKKGDWITQGEIRDLLKLTYKPVKKILSELEQKGLIHSASQKQRIHFYRLDERVRSPFF
ncbi:winged helix-turn-helix transcriptional regulator [Ammoniphilus sp. YIM 78166]|uniref:winged helix-turn-helix transcriptional regulator n=1 Tax=Ammoniphilus sp. YIM 78166 TaxID=1644106 RepID=UPI001F0DBAE9|nr:winged helix-turn-helix transcriptional regulator [Ammoniphilus sp. YIM 78166]